MSITELSLTELCTALENKELSSVEAIKACLDRINATKELNNFITVCEDSALAAAKCADKLRLKGEDVSPMCGWL